MQWSNDFDHWLDRREALARLKARWVAAFVYGGLLVIINSLDSRAAFGSASGLIGSSGASA